MATHIASEELAAYLAGTLDAESREQLDAHLAECRACREEMVHARRLIAGATPAPRWPYITTGLLAAAVALILLVPRNRAPAPAGDTVRAEPPAPSQDSMAIVTPAEGSAIPARDVVFIWHQRPGDPLYRISLSDAAGRELWRSETSDTVAALPASIVLGKGETFYWYVDALAASGQSVSTGARSFMTER